MRLVFLGPPGAGKGTHAKIFGEKHDLAHLAAGDCLRRNIRENTELGKQAKDIIENGELVHDDLVNQMMAEEIRKAKGGNAGFILDGYPRTIGQAEALEAVSKSDSVPLDAAIDFATSEGVIVSRLSGRRVCPQCNANYHIHNIPPSKEGICDQCGSKLKQRKDDNPETIRHRLEVYEKETAPLIDFYKDRKLLYPVHGDYEILELQDELAKLSQSLKLTK